MECSNAQIMFKKKTVTFSSRWQGRRKCACSSPVWAPELWLAVEGGPWHLAKKIPHGQGQTRSRGETAGRHKQEENQSPYLLGEWRTVWRTMIQRSPCTVVKVLNPTSGFWPWGSDKGMGIDSLWWTVQIRDLWRRQFCFRTRDLSSVTQNLVWQKIYYSKKRNRESFWHRHQKWAESAS